MSCCFDCFSLCFITSAAGISKRTICCTGCFLSYFRNEIMSKGRNLLYVFFCITVCTVFTLLTSFCAGSFLIYHIILWPCMSSCRDCILISWIRIMLTTYLTNANFFPASFCTSCIFCFYSITFTMNRNIRIIFIVTNKIIPSFTCSIIAAEF